MDDSAFWHMCWQAAGAHDFVADRALALRIRQQIVAAHHEPGRTLITFLLAPAEIHILARLPSGEGPWTLVRPFSVVISRWLRQRDPAGGPVFASRVAAHTFTCDTEVRTQIRMIAWRPVLCQLCRSPMHALHSSLRVALGIVAGEGYDCRPLLGLYGGTVPQSRAALRRSLKRRPSAREVGRWELVSRLAPLKRGPGERATKLRGVGSEAAAQLVAAGGDGLPGALQILERWVLTQLGLHEEGDIRGGHGTDSARVRALVACLAVHHRLCSASAVARYFGRSKATLCEQMIATKRCVEDRRIIGTAIQEIVGEVEAAGDGVITAAAFSRPNTMTCMVGT
ncbi:hypothetical protein [Piscinibacter sakaiensis]|uniref:hypothetical protein n=1 Tax=Piscinibacter sakaiensis TaxID=1547922 RepID=UPI003AAE76F1